MELTLVCGGKFRNQCQVTVIPLSEHLAEIITKEFWEQSKLTQCSQSVPSIIHTKLESAAKEFGMWGSDSIMKWSKVCIDAQQVQATYNFQYNELMLGWWDLLMKGTTMLRYVKREKEAWAKVTKQKAQRSSKGIELKDAPWKFVWHTT